MQITVLHKKVYGQDKFYPACRLAEQFAGIVGQKTLTFTDLQKIKDMEVSIKIIQEEIKV